MLYVVQGVVLTAAAVVLLSLQQEPISRALRVVSGGRSLSLRLGLAYPLARRSRTGLTIAMYALVVFILTFITSLAHMIDQQVVTATRDVQGGYAVVVSSSSAGPLTSKQIAPLDGVTSVAPLSRAIAFFRVGSMTTDIPWNLTAFDRRFIAGTPPTLYDRGKYPTDRAAWEAVLADDSLAIVDPEFLRNGTGPGGFIPEPGTKVTVKDPHTGRTRELTVAALAPSDYFIANGMFYGADGARTLFGYEPTFDRMYVGLRPGVNPDAFAGDVQSRFVENGAEAVAIRTIMDEGFTMTRQIFQLFEGYLAMGLIVGIAGTAVVMVRAVRERRRQIGTLQSARLRRPPRGAELRDRVGLHRGRGHGHRRRARARDALRHRGAERLVRLADLLGPVFRPRRAARRDRHGIAARNGVARDLGQPDPSRGGPPDDRLTRRASRGPERAGP